MISLYCCSDRGEALGEKIVSYLEGRECSNRELNGRECSNKNLVINETLNFYPLDEAKARGGIKACVASDFKASSALIFIGATGIAVRAIAPFVDSKFSDPAVLVIDDQGRFVISLLSGHIGGGNALACEIAEAIGAVPVVTTATDGMGLASMDLILKASGVPVQNYRDLALKLNSLLLKGEPMALYTEEPLKLSACKMEGVKLLQNWEDFLSETKGYKLYIGNRLSRLLEAEKLENSFGAVPQNLVMGTGSRKELDKNIYRQTYESYMASLDLSPKAVRVLASVELKAEESCMLALAETYQMKTVFFTKEELSVVHEAFPKSEQVFKVLGINGVAGPAAYILSQGHLLEGMWKGSGCTFAIGREQTW